jgi:hypothetical protein
MKPTGPNGAVHASTQVTRSYCRRNVGDGTAHLPPVDPGDGQFRRLAAREGRFYYLRVRSHGDLGAAARRGGSLGPADGSHLPALSSAAEELIATNGLEPQHTHSGPYLEPFQDLSRSRIDSSHVALITFPCALPELAVNPGDPGDQAVGLVGAKSRPYPIPIAPHPEHPFGPSEPGITAAGRRDRGEHTRARESLLITHSGPEAPITGKSEGSRGYMSQR